MEHENRVYSIRGKSGDKILIGNMKERIFSKDATKTIKLIEKYYDNIKEKRFMQIEQDKVILAINTNSNNIEITNTEVVRLYNEIISLFHKDIFSYSVIIMITQRLKEINIDEINNITDKIDIINQLLNLCKTNTAETANLKIVGLSENCGKLRIGKNLKNGMKFVSESITGYYKEIIFEVK